MIAAFYTQQLPDILILARCQLPIHTIQSKLSDSGFWIKEGAVTQVVNVRDFFFFLDSNVIC